MEIKCENCDNLWQIKDSFFCDKCGYLNSIILDIDFFCYFGFLASCNLNLAELESIYLNKMNKYHPDKFVKKSEKEQLNALAHSVYLNEAYNTLKNRTTRIIYLYKILYHEDISLETNISDYNFNLEFFDLYEELESTVSSVDVSNFITKIEGIEDEVIIEINNIFQTNQEKFKENCLKLQFLLKIKNQAQKKYSLG